MSQGQPRAVDLVPHRKHEEAEARNTCYRPAMPGSPPDHGERPYEETLGIDTGATQALQQLLLEQETNLLASFQELLKEQEARINLSLLAGLDRRMDALLGKMPHGAVAGRRTLSAAKPMDKPAHLREEAPSQGKPKADDAAQKRDAFGDRQSPLKRSFTRQFHVELPHAGQDMRRWWYGEEPILPTDTRMQAWGKRSRKFLESPTFGKALAAFIFLNCCSLGWQVDWGVQNHASPEPAHFEVLGMMFTLIFLAEFGIRCFAYGRAMYICQNPDVGWNTFDGLLVLSSLIDEIMSRAASGINVTALRVLRLARLLRILRVFRVVRYFTDLRVMVNGILVSSKTLVWALVLLFMLMFAVAACILQLLRPYLSSLDLSVEAKEQLAQQLLLHFGTLLGGIFTLFSSMSGGVDWADVARMLNEVSLLLALLFVVYMCFALFCVLNVMTGVFVENASRMTAADEEMCMMEELRARKDYVDTVSRLFSECDIDNSGNVNWEEFQACASDLHFQTCFKKLGIAIDTEAELRNVFHMLDFQNNGSVSVEEFAIGIQMFSGGAKSIDVARLMFEVATVKKYMANVHEALVGPVDPDDHPEFIGAQQNRHSEVVSEEMLGEVPGQHDAKPTEDGQGMQGVVPVHAPMKAWLD
eukprot:s2205_g15.t1